MRHLIALALFAVLWGGAAQAVLRDDDEVENDPPEGTPTATVCRDGHVWDDRERSCVEPESGALDADVLYGAVRKLAYAGRYPEALRVLAAMPDQASPRVLAARGYILRKTGRVPEGLALYDAALAADPDFLLARAYRGMYYVEIGKRRAAEAELAEIEARGGAGSWPHTALERALDGAEPY